MAEAEAEALAEAEAEALAEAEAEAAAGAMVVGVVVASQPHRQQSSGDYIGHTIVINIIVQKLFVSDRRTN